jgi:hypothetical protein
VPRGASGGATTLPPILEHAQLVRNNAAKGKEEERSRIDAQTERAKQKLPARSA